MWIDLNVHGITVAEDFLTTRIKGLILTGKEIASHLGITKLRGEKKSSKDHDL